MFDDDQEAPNIMVATFKLMRMAARCLFEVRHWITNSEAGILSVAEEIGAVRRDIRDRWP